MLNEGDVLVEVSLCTICGSDLHTVTGRRPAHGPMILGHEAVGRIADVIGSVFDIAGTKLAAGDRVTWTIARSCQSCFFCTNGLPQKCQRLTKFGHVSLDHGPQGGMASHCLVPEGTGLLKAGEELGDDVLAPANCCTATSAAALRTAGEISGQTVLIFGAGALGLTAVSMAVHDGAAGVILCDQDAARLERASTIPECRTLLWQTESSESGEPLDQLVADETDSRGVDLVLEMSGATDAFEAGLTSLRTGGRLMLVGAVFPAEALPVAAEDIVRRMLRIEGVHNYRPDDLLRAVQFLKNSAADSPVHQLVERVYTLDDVNAAVECALNDRPLRVGIRPAGQ